MFLQNPDKSSPSVVVPRRKHMPELGFSLVGMESCKMYLDELCNVLNYSLTKDAMTLKFNVLLNESEYHGSCNLFLEFVITECNVTC